MNPKDENKDNDKFNDSLQSIVTGIKDKLETEGTSINTQVLNSKSWTVLDNPSEDLFVPGYTQNPVDYLQFSEVIARRKKKTQNKSKNPKSLIFRIIGFSLVIATFLFIPSIPNVLGKVTIKLITAPLIFAERFCASVENFVIDQITSPYVITFGEYGNLAIAKNEAKKLVPVFKQINIKQLSSGIYTFEIDRFNSKKKAYKEASRFEQSGYDAVHVRYLRD